MCKIMPDITRRVHSAYNPEQLILIITLSNLDIGRFDRMFSQTFPIPIIGMIVMNRLLYPASIIHVGRCQHDLPESVSALLSDIASTEFMQSRRILRQVEL